MKNLTFRHEPMCDFFDKYHIDGLTDKDGKPIYAVLHHFTDFDRGDPHDHPFSFISYIIHGWYIEKVYNLDTLEWQVFERRAGQSHFVLANTVHKIVEVSEGGFYSMITPKKKVKEPCFYRFEDGKVFVRQHNENEFKPLNF